MGDVDRAFYNPIIGNKDPFIVQYSIGDARLTVLRDVVNEHPEERASIESQ